MSGGLGVWGMGMRGVGLSDVVVHLTAAEDIYGLSPNKFCWDCVALSTLLIEARWTTGPTPHPEHLTDRLLLLVMLLVMLLPLARIATGVVTG